jgi:hypothetical protein
MSGQPRSDREWEYWPQERRLDEGIRHRLRGLFHPSGHSDEVVEDFVAQHSRELESRAAQLAETIADLERREQRTTELRVAVEQMLRRGSVELDERHAELAELAARLAERESLAAETEELLAERRTELGAVELRRAALERREAALAEREESLEQRLEGLVAREELLADVEQRAAELVARSTEVAAGEQRLSESSGALERARQEQAARLAALEERERDAARLDTQALEVEQARAVIAARETDLDSARTAVEHERETIRKAVATLAETLGLGLATGTITSVGVAGPAVDDSAHLMLVPGERYRLVETDGPVPAAGTVLEFDGAGFAVVRTGPSPLPEDRRRCAFLERLHEPK